MILSRRENTGNRKEKCCIILCEELALEEGRGCGLIQQTVE
jgi:hypothetical protein